MVMEKIQFTKMHGTSNDYIYINAIKQQISNPAKLAVKMSNRHTGIGADGIILIHKSEKADFKMKMYNSDGSEAEMCGNGIRCFAKYVYDKKLTTKSNLTIETLAGIRSLELKTKDNLVKEVTVDMGEPILEREKIPMLGDKGKVLDETIELEDGVKFNITAVSIGNPHIIIYVEDAQNFPVHKYGPMLENHPLFPNRTNVEFIQIINENEVIQRTWERGAGETMACGTGATAVTVAGVLNKKTNHKLKVNLLGGNLNLKWDKKTNHVFMTGPAIEVFSGSWQD
jgi:diaminopimelate epimerase